MPAISSSSESSSLPSATSVTSTTAAPATPRHSSLPSATSVTSTTAVPATPTRGSRSSTTALPATPSSSSDHGFPDEDKDSAIGSSRPQSSCTLSPSYTNYTFEYGRRYHDLERYFLPNDEEELDRLDDEYGAMSYATGDKLVHAPISRMHRCLDLGTGRGLWVFQMGDRFPEAELFGVDLSPIQPRNVPPNVQFYVMDVEDKWFFSEGFDLIRCSRLLCGNIANRREFFINANKNCRDGDYLELHELDMKVESQVGIVPEDVQVWYRLMRNGMKDFGNRTLDLGSIDIVGLMNQAGFTDIVSKPTRKPIGPWSKDHLLRWAGVQQLDAMLDGISGMSLAILTKSHHWEPEEIEVLLAGVRRSLKKGEYQLYIPG